MTNLVHDDYKKFLASLKERVRAAQLRAAVGANAELIQL